MIKAGTTFDPYNKSDVKDCYECEYCGWRTLSDELCPECSMVIKKHHEEEAAAGIL